MKKIINVIGLVVLVVTMSFNASVFMSDTDSNIDLASLITVADANAECTPYDLDYCESIETESEFQEIQIVDGKTCERWCKETGTDCVGFGDTICDRVIEVRECTEWKCEA